MNGTTPGGPLPPDACPIDGGGYAPPVAPPCLLVLFGASGDLAARKLVPALFGLHRDGLLPERFALLGVSRAPMGDDAFRDRMRTAAAEFGSGPFDAPAWDAFAPSLFHQPGDVFEEASFVPLALRAERVCVDRGIPGNLLFYAAVAPAHFEPLVRALGRSGLSAPSPALPGFRRIVVEKPFGSDLAGARSLGRQLAAVFREEQLFRIDHYLGKETVQNLLVLRFGNGIFEPLWNRNYVDHVQVTVAESIGVEGRGEYYEKAGAARDMVQNHLLQLMALVAMEPPVSLAAEDIRDEKRKLFHAIEPVAPGDAGRACVRGQYAEGVVGGKPVPGYRAERSVAPDSRTETYAAFRFSIDNWRWGGVPFYLRTGKRLRRTVTEIAIRFRQAPTLLFGDTPCGQMVSNWLVIGVQPDEEIRLRFGAKAPGPSICVRPVELSFDYRKAFGGKETPAYGRLLLDAMLGDATLFPRMDSVEAAWSLLEPFLARWRDDPGADLRSYPAGSDGPADADALFSGREGGWRPL